MARTTLMTAACICLLLLPQPVEGQSADEFKKAIESLNETQKAILKELQDIKKVLATQQTARPAADAVPTTPIDISKEPFKGAANAKVALIEYSDFECPFCARYGKDTYPQLLKEYVDTGKIKYVWRDLPLDFHKRAFKAAEAAHCAGEQGRFWEMHDKLFENSKNLAPEELPKFAQAVQIDSALFQQCLDSGRYSSDIKKDITDANGVGITGTPSFLIGVVQPNGTVRVTRKLVGAKSFGEFKAALDALLTSPAPSGAN